MHKRQSSFFQFQRRTKGQRGFLMLEVGLALIVAAGAAALAVISAQRADEAASAMNQADNLNFIRDAAETLIQEKYIDYQAGQPIVRNGVTLPFGTGSGQSMQPTVAQMKTMALGIDGASEQGFFKTLANANYRVNIQRVPAGCELAPNPANGAACNITGTVCFDAPLRPFGAPVGEVDGFSIGKMLGRLGGNGGAAILGAQANITGSGGGWSIPNPIAGAPAGIVCARFGFGASGLAAFLRVNDTRDPNFQGGTTIAGNTSTGATLQVNGAGNITGAVNIGGATTVTGLSTFNGGAEFNSTVTVKDPSTGTVCIQLLNQGQIDVNCNGILNAKAGTFTGPLGAVKVGDTGTLYTVDTAGKIRGQQGFFSAVGSVFGDNSLGVRSAASVFTVQTSAGVDALAVHDSGRIGARTSLASPSIGLSNPVTAGTACLGSAAEVPATNATSAATTVLRALAGGGLAACINNLWTPITQTAAPGQACALDGVAAISTADGRSLTCHNGYFVQVKDLLSSFVLMATYRVTNGSIVNKPTCGQVGVGVGSAVAIITGQVESSTNSSFTRRADDLGPSWRTVLQDSNGNALAGSPQGEALFAAYCYY